MASLRKCRQSSPHFEDDCISLRSTASSLNSATLIQNVLPTSINIGVGCPSTGIKNIFVMRPTESVGHLRRHALQRSKLFGEEALNYGLYLPAQANRKGKFLEDERPISDYPVLLASRNTTEGSPIPSTSTTPSGESSGTTANLEPCWLELIHKARMNTENIVQSSRFRKVKTKVTQSYFMELVRNQDIRSIQKLLAKGFDPNFWSRKDGETPIAAAVVNFHPRELILTLVDGGAHIDFRARDSRTALHRAAVCGNYEAIQTLLDLGQNPNCMDNNGFTPLYYAVSTDISARCTHALLYDHAILGVQDEQGFQEIHQACRANRTQHLENLIAYGADLNARTKKGHTPLHVCVLHEANACLQQLLLRGADSSQFNDDDQTPLDYALLTNRNAQARILLSFNPLDVVPIRETPSYNPARRPTLNGPRGAVTYSMMRQNSTQSTSSPASSLFDSASSLGASDRASSITSFGSPPVKRTSEASFASQSRRRRVDQRRLSAHLEAFDADPKRKLSEPNQVPASSTSVGTTKLYVRIAAMLRGPDGFGFILNGIPRQALQKYNMSNHRSLPSNQFFSTVIEGSPADRAGVNEGDFVLQIDGQDVTDCCHEDAVDLIKNCGNSLILQVATWLASPQTGRPNKRQEYRRSISANEDSSYSSINSSCLINGHVEQHLKSPKSGDGRNHSREGINKRDLRLITSRLQEVRDCNNSVRIGTANTLAPIVFERAEPKTESFVSKYTVHNQCAGKLKTSGIEREQNRQAESSGSSSESNNSDIDIMNALSLTPRQNLQHRESPFVVDYSDNQAAVHRTVSVGLVNQPQSAQSYTSIPWVQGTSYAPFEVTQSSRLKKTNFSESYPRLDRL